MYFSNQPRGSFPLWWWNIFIHEGLKVSQMTMVADGDWVIGGVMDESRITESQNTKRRRAALFFSVLSSIKVHAHLPYIY